MTLGYVAWFVLSLIVSREADRWYTLGKVIGLGLIIAGVFAILPGIFKSSFGRELWNKGLACEIASDSTPDTDSRIDSVTLRPIERTTSPWFTIVANLREMVGRNLVLLNLTTAVIRRVEISQRSALFVCYGLL
jgi:hypothetical protein